MTENTPTENQSDLFPELKNALEGFERQEFYHDTLPYWQSAIKGKNKPDAVVSTHTYEQIKEAFETGVAIDFEFVYGFTTRLVSKDYDFGRGEHKYLTDDAPGKRSIVVEIKETTGNQKLFVEGLRVGRKSTYSRKNVNTQVPNPEEWTALCFDTWIHEANYNGGISSGKSYYEVKCKNGKITWSKKESKEDR